MNLLFPVEWITLHFATLTAILHTLGAVCATIHILFNKSDTRAAVGWVGLVWLSPGIGLILYWIFGINRIKRRAVALRGRSTKKKATYQADSAALKKIMQKSQFSQSQGFGWMEVAGNQVQHFSIVGGNHLEILQNGSDAYPRMLSAIESAQQSVGLSSYIFNSDKAGMLFIKALKQAQQRGVAVRVLIDALGSHYSFPSIVGRLKREGIRVKRFLPAQMPWQLGNLNLRNHRKLLLIDGKLAFTGGLNISAENSDLWPSSHPICDTHFLMRGQIVEQLQSVFVSDWEFATGEKLDGESWFPPLRAQGESLCRSIVDGPDEHLGKIYWTILSAISNSMASVQIQTPYFLPDTAMIRMLSVASLSGKKVQILLPENNNLKFVQWASYPILHSLTLKGVEFRFLPGPFDHSKIMLVDDYWALVGSSNMDPRSLRINFEANVECWDPTFQGQLKAMLQAKWDKARPVSLEEFVHRPYVYQLRDRLVGLMRPYL